MSDKLREAALAVLKNTKSLHVCCGDFNHSKKDLHRDDNCPPWRRYNDALSALEAALAESAVKESLTARPWVGLTDEEYEWCLNENFPVIRAVELLKEKNHV